MKFVLIKNKIQKQKTTASQRGFVALFSVLVSSILLLMALSIAGIAYKEQLLSVNAKSSQYSFVAADTGMECALYNDVKLQWFTSTNSPASIMCGGDSVEMLGDISGTTLFVYKLPVEANVNGNIVPGCAIFSIDKDYDYLNADGSTTNSTKIDSRGYNVLCSNIEYGLGGSTTLTFLNGAGARAVERYLSALYSNGN
ncbi:MAG: hypothetical protein KA028_03315 [Candidatus Pacebacteria bacterium]|nr:hypothetical protein [Candidatus Paceibacterota bacterium]